MKRKWMAILLAAAIILSTLSGCGDANSQGTAAVHNTELSPKNTKVTTKEGVTVDVGDYVLDGPEKLTVTKQKTEENTEEGYKIEAYDISLGDMTELGDFITIRIPYDPNYCEKGQDPARCVGAKYKNESTGIWEDVLFTVDAEAKELVIYTDHLSVYGAFHVENEGKRNAYITDILDPSAVLGPGRTLELAEKIAQNDPDVMKELWRLGWDLVDEGSQLLQDVDPIKNLIYFLEDPPDWLALNIPETDLDLYAVAGYILTCRSVAELARQQYFTGSVDEGKALSLIKEIATGAMVDWSKKILKESAQKSLTVSMSGVYILEKMLMAMGEEAVSTRQEDISFVYHHYNEGFVGFGRKPKTHKDWRELVIQVLEKHPGDLDRAQAALESAFNKYAMEFFDLTEEQMAEVAADTPGVTIKRIPHISNEDKYTLINEYIAHLKSNIMPAVMTSARNYWKRQMEQRQLEVLQKIKDRHNAPISITMKEDIPEGGSSMYAGYRFRFAPLSKNASVNNWSGTWPKEGIIKDTATFTGFMTAGFPHTLEFFPPGADLNKDKPEFTVPFVINTPKIDIVISGKEPLALDAFMGTWINSKGKRMILMASGSNIIMKSPDLSWYGGDVVCTEYRVEYDENNQVLKMYGLTSWVVGPDLLDATVYEKRPLEVDASTSTHELKAEEVKDGVITKLSERSQIYKRP